MSCARGHREVLLADSEAVLHAQQPARLAAGTCLQRMMTGIVTCAEGLQVVTWHSVVVLCPQACTGTYNLC